MAFREVQFPVHISVDVSDGPEFSTTVRITEAGAQRRGVRPEVKRLAHQIARLVCRALTASRRA